MTRLVKQDLEGLEQELIDYDRQLLNKTGLNLAQIACRAAGLPEEELSRAAAEQLVAVIPITCGQGLIPLFVESVKAIVRHLGFNAEITRQTDVAGISEGMERGAGVLFMADDLSYIALNPRQGRLADNGEATGRGFVVALDAMAGGLKGDEVLVLGAGPVGQGAISQLQRMGAAVAALDQDPVKQRLLQQQPGVRLETDLRKALENHTYIVDATPEGGFIKSEYLRAGAMLAIPGMPPGLTSEGMVACRERVIHDPLQIGTAVMLAMAVNCRQ